MLTQLQTPIPLKTPKGKAWAVAVIDYGPQWDLQWVTFVHETGECWTFLNHEIRQEENLTFNIPKPSPVFEPARRASMRAKLVDADVDNCIAVMRPKLPDLQKQNA